MILCAIMASVLSPYVSWVVNSRTPVPLLFAVPVITGVLAIIWQFNAWLFAEESQAARLAGTSAHLGVRGRKRSLNQRSNATRFPYRRH